MWRQEGIAVGTRVKGKGKKAGGSNWTRLFLGFQPQQFGYLGYIQADVGYQACTQAKAAY